MKNHEKILSYLDKRGVKPTKKVKVVTKQADLKTAAKEKELLLRIATDLGYIS